MPDPRPKFTNVEQLQEKIDAWHAQRVAENLPLTITSLAIALDTTRDLLLDYASLEGCGAAGGASLSKRLLGTDDERNCDVE